MAKYPTSSELLSNLKTPNMVHFAILESYTSGDPYSMSYADIAKMLKEMACSSRMFLWKVYFTRDPSFCNLGRHFINLSTISTPFQTKCDVYVALHELGHLLHGPSEIKASAFAASLILAHEKKRLGDAFPNAYVLRKGNLVRA
ncbi:MAG: hypothetical protein WC455_10450 [Dehalococcoidia bacterium]|jgi:hypothetical protein